MAYRRRYQQGVSPSRPSSTFEGFADEGIRNPPPPPCSLSSSVGDASNDFDSSFPSPPSLAAKAIRASSARRDSSLSSVYGHSNLSNASPNTVPTRTAPSPSEDSRTYEYTSMKNMNESKHGFWDVLARKAKSILDDDSVDQQHETYERTGSQIPGTTSRGKFSNSSHLQESNIGRDNSKLLKGLGAISSSLSHIGGTIGNALEEGITIVENRTSGIIHETRRHIKKNPGNSEGQSQETKTPTSWKQSQLRPQMQTDQELQLKASRDVAMAMAAKAKLLLRELKTVKADLAFAKERCAQLEEENKSLRENRERGGNPEDDDLIRLQLETLLAEKARLANENSIYARENRFLREVVEYHQLTMQDVVYFDESNEEVTEVNPLNFPPVSNTQPILGMSSEVTRNITSSITGKDAKSSEVTRSISSITGKATK